MNGELLEQYHKLLLLFSLCDISIKKQEFLLENVKDFSVERVLSSEPFLVHFTREEQARVLKEYDARKLENILQNIENSGIKLLTIFDENYPSKLKNLPDRPLILYAKGDLSLLEMDSVGIVGTRSPSNYGRIITEQFAGKLAQSGLVIVSGLCYGVDTIAHRKTLDVAGKTIAVIGSGFSNIYPACNTALAEEIAKNGLILSEYPPSYTAKRYTFPRRNRIIAGLSMGVLITEASIKSGTIHTKEFALEYGRDVFAVPGNINNPKSELPNNLIKNSNAECVLSADDILDFYGIKKVDVKKKTLNLSIDQQIIIKILQDGEKDFDMLAKLSKIPVNILNSCLTTLEISGLIKRLPGKMFALA